MSEYTQKWTGHWGTGASDAPPGGHWIGNTLVPPRASFAGQGLKGAPDVWAKFEIRDGAPEVVEFRITAKHDGRAVRTSDLNSWQPLEGLALNAFLRVGRIGDREHGAWPPRAEREKWAMEGDLERAKARRRTPNTAELEEVAKVYREALHGRPTEAVQVQLGYSRRTAARRVEQARAAGILPPTTKGKVAG